MCAGTYKQESKKRVEFRCGPILYCDFAFYHTLVRYLGEEKIEELDLNGTVETLQAAVSPMTWCAGISANADLKDTIKSMCVELFEGKYATGADFCKALDALY